MKTHIVVAVFGGLIEEVQVHSDRASAIKAAKSIWRKMDGQSDDCKAFDSNGAIVWQPKA